MRKQALWTWRHPDWPDFTDAVRSSVMRRLGLDMELRGLLSANKELATKVHALERKVSVHERNIGEPADSMAELLATPAPPPKRPIGFINPEDKGKKAASQAKSKTPSS